MQRFKSFFMFKNWGYFLFLLVVIRTSLILFNLGPYMKCDPPADVEKAEGIKAEEKACWLATAANMLAAAGYGDLTGFNEQGTEIQYRADQIYKDMLCLYDGGQSGWAETAIKGWLCSSYNEWPNNYYKITMAYGLETPPEGWTTNRAPWFDPQGPRKIANHLRLCDFVAVLIAYPDISSDGTVQATWGHWLTSWGDEASNLILLYNPDTLRVTDSDLDDNGDVQVYEYQQSLGYQDIEDQYQITGLWKPFWCLNYESKNNPDSNLKDPFIRQVVILSRPYLLTSATYVPISLGSYRFFIPQNFEAHTLRYEIAADADILNLTTVLDGVNQLRYEAEDLKENQKKYIVEWDFKDDPLRLDQQLTISTELAQPGQTGMTYQNLYLGAAGTDRNIAVPDIGWTISTEKIPKEKREHFALGGYVIGSFDVYPEKGDVTKMRPLAQYRFIHQYKFSQSPSNHWFTVNGASGFYITNVRFGHSYGFLESEALWSFDNWKVSFGREVYPLRVDPIEMELNFGPIPYPTIDEPSKAP
jgi:hypothetical protein